LEALNRNFVLSLNVDIGPVGVQALKAITVLPIKDGIDAIGVSKDPQLTGKGIPGPSIVNLNCHIVGIHFVDLNHVLIVIAHCDITGIRHDHFWALVAIRQHIGWFK
jgi:hypothetical protein